jgi:hypothetical protein
MSRYDRKRWWDGRPQTRKDRRKWYGIVVFKIYDTWEADAQLFFRPKVRIEYRLAEWVKGVVYHVDQKMPLEEAEVMCKLLNAAEENKT